MWQPHYTTITATIAATTTARVQATTLRAPLQSVSKEKDVSGMVTQESMSKVSATLPAQSARAKTSTKLLLLPHVSLALKLPVLMGKTPETGIAQARPTLRVAVTLKTSGHSTTLRLEKQAQAARKRGLSVILHRVGAVHVDKQVIVQLHASVARKLSKPDGVPKQLVPSKKIKFLVEPAQRTRVLP